MSEWIDIGDDHAIKYFSWSPDRTIESNAVLFAGVPDIQKAGCSVKHKKPDGSECMGAVHFDVPGAKEIFGGPAHVWQVQSWEPLTLSPSLQCGSCPDHGFIRGGKWVRA